MLRLYKLVAILFFVLLLSVSMLPNVFAVDIKGFADIVLKGITTPTVIYETDSSLPVYNHLKNQDIGVSTKDSPDKRLDITRDSFKDKPDILIGPSWFTSNESPINIRVSILFSPQTNEIKFPKSTNAG